MANPYRGRFAPTPSGPLHLGSLLAALGSFLAARAQGGIWLVRMEDLDTPRVQPSAASSILQTLALLGLVADEPVLYQSTRRAAYADACERLKQPGLLYPCACSRATIAQQPNDTGEEAIYPGTCRAGLPPGRTPRSWRLRVDGDPSVSFTDAIQGQYTQRLTRAVGDFVLHRADGIYAYHLAVVVDDAQQGITHIVRGADLLSSTPRQIYLQRALQLPTPSYAHLPVLVNPRGEKLSKQTQAAPILPDGRLSTEAEKIRLLIDALTRLGQSPPQNLARARLHETLAWALAHWTTARIPAQRTIPLPPTAPTG